MVGQEASPPSHSPSCGEKGNGAHNGDAGGGASGTLVSVITLSAGSGASDDTLQAISKGAMLSPHEIERHLAPRQ